MKILHDNYTWINTAEAYQSLSKSPAVYLLTRFNLKFWKTAKSGMDTRSTEWLRKRFELFETYCMPSVRNQTYSEFLWFCLFSDDTPQEWLDRLVEIKKQCRQFYPLLLSDKEGEEHDRVLGRFLDSLHFEGQQVVTLRIDNDDAIGSDFIERAIDIAKSQEEEKAVYWFETGLQYYHHRKVAFHIRSPHNHYPFLVVKHSALGNNTILAFSHRGIMPECYTKRVLVSEEMWLEVIHDDNVMNEVRLDFTQSPFTDELTFNKKFGSLPLLTRRHHYLTFLLPRMAKHFVRRFYQKVIGIG